MLGLRTQEDYRTVKFCELVQKEAQKKSAVFFFGCGEGHDLWKDDIICSDCSGWLIPNDKVEAFRKEYESFADLDVWEDYVAWVTWSQDGNDIEVVIELL